MNLVFDWILLVQYIIFIYLNHDIKYFYYFKINNITVKYLNNQTMTMKALTKVLTNNESIDEKKMQQLKY